MGHLEACETRQAYRLLTVRKHFLCLQAAANRLNADVSGRNERAVSGAVGVVELIGNTDRSIVQWLSQNLSSFAAFRHRLLDGVVQLFYHQN